MDGLHLATYISASVGLAGFLVVAARIFIGVGELTTAARKVPGEMATLRMELREEISGIREDLKTSSENSQLLLQSHGERLAVVEAMLDLDDTAQAKEGPRRRLRGRGGREI